MLYQLRYGLRQLRRAPGFTLTATLTLALGIGATTAIFTLIHAVLQTSLPVANPNQLYRIGDADPGKHGGVWSGLEDDWSIFSYDLYKHLRDSTPGFESLTAFQGEPRRVGVRRSGDAEAAQSFFGEYVAGNYFSTFGVGTFAGRVIGPPDDNAGAAPVAVLSYRTWQMRYASDPSVIGATFQVNGTPLTIVGIAPAGFFGDTLRNSPTDLWMPLSAEPVVNRGHWIDNPGLHWLYIMGRISPQADPAALESRLKVELQHWLVSRPSGITPSDQAQITRQTLHLLPGGAGIETMRNNYAGGLQLLMAASGFVLLIVCANLANLALVRGLERKQQTCISMALGAGKSRLIRQALLESVLVGLIGGVGGLAIAFAAMRALLAAVFSQSRSVPIEATPDLTMLAFALCMSVGTGIVFGIAPAWMASRADPIEALRGAGRSTRHSGARTQRTLVVLQAALSLVLLVSAGLLAGSLRNLQNQKFGFEAANRIAIHVDPTLAGYKIPQLDALYRRVRERLMQLPGAQSVSYCIYSPLSGGSWSGQVVMEGEAGHLSNDTQSVSMWNRIGPNYFETVGTHLLRGRTIGEQDTAQTGHVAVVNEQFVRRFLPNQDPIGKHFGNFSPKYSRSFEIVGVVEDTKYRDTTAKAPPMYFLPFTQTIQYDDASGQAFETRSLYAADMVVRLAANDESIAPAILRAFSDIDPNLAVSRIQTFENQVTGNFSQQKLIARLCSLFGLTALVLASIGLYGIASYSVQQRTREIGIRVALGAGRGDILGSVLRNTYTLVGVGLAAGIPLTIAAGRALRSKLYGISPSDPAILAAAVALLAGFALVAIVAPARRAASIDPVETLRAE